MNLAIVIAAILSGAQADHTGDGFSAQSAAGQWRLSAVGGKVGCTISLTDQERTGGLDLRAPAACQRAFPLLREFTLWKLDQRGSLRFTDRLQFRSVEFTGPVGGPYAAIAPDGHKWRLTSVSRPAPDSPH